MLGKILHIYLAEVTQPGMHRHKGKVYTFDFHTLHQLAAEMKSGSGSCHSPFVLGKDSLETLGIFLFYRTTDETGQRSLSQRIQCLLELVVRTFIEETQRTSTGSGVINHLGHHGIVLTKIKLVTDADLTGRIDQHIPQVKLLVQLAQQEYLDTGSGLFLISIQTCRENFRIIKDKHIFIIKIIQDILEDLVFNLAC